ncbi:hypothetical protein BGZ98_010142 [Dissophora globulifera]|nr:hypothetical protein BGZ98_010142 [Dissophora globulifera]
MAHETVLFYLQISLPDDLSTLHEETSLQVQEFFHSLEIQVEAAFVDALALAQSSQGAMYKSPNGSRPSSAQLGDKPGPGSPAPFGGPRPGGYGEQGRVESTLLYSYAYNAAEPGKEVEIRPINGVWTAIFPFSVPVSYIRTKSTNTMLMLSSHVLLRTADQVVPVVAPVDDQYNLECFSMVNLLEGLSDDPTFATSVVPQHHYRSDKPRAQVQALPMMPVLRRSARRTIAVRSALNVRMRTTRVSPMDNPLMMSIEVENNSEHGAKFKATNLDVEVTHAVVTPLDSAELTKLPIMLHSSDHVTFLFSISLLESPDWTPESPVQGAGGLFASGPHSRHSSENLAQSASLRDSQRQVVIVLQGVPEIDGVSGQTIHSRWNCSLDISDLAKRDNAPIPAGGQASSQKQLFAPRPSHPSSLLPSQTGAPGTPTNAYQQNQQQFQSHSRNQSLPSSPQPPQGGLQRNTSVARRISSSSSPPVLNSNTNRNSAYGDSRVRRSSVHSDGTPSQQQQRGGSGSGSALSGAGRKSGLGGWGYGRSNDQGLAPVHEGASHHSPLMAHGIAEGNETDVYEDETPHHAAVGGGAISSQSGRPALSGSAMISPGLGFDLAAQALNGATRAEQESGDGIVVSFAVTDRVVVGKIFNLEIFIVNRSRHIRRYTLVVPNRKRAKGGDPSLGSKVLPPLPSGERGIVQNVPIDPYMEEPELLRRHVDNETTEADIICLENNVRLSPLYPLTCQNLNLRFIAIKEQLHTIDLVQLVDNDTGFVTNLRNCLCFMAEASFGALSQGVPDA